MTSWMPLNASSISLITFPTMLNSEKSLCFTVMASIEGRFHMKSLNNLLKALVTLLRIGWPTIPSSIASFTNSKDYSKNSLPSMTSRLTFFRRKASLAKCFLQDVLVDIHFNRSSYWIIQIPLKITLWEFQIMSLTNFSATENPHRHTCKWIWIINNANSNCFVF